MAYSIRYDKEDGSYTQYAADWDWIFSSQWARSEKEGTECEWRSKQGLDDGAYMAILKHFGLEDFAEFPLIKNRVITMSPALLKKLRRKKERVFGLPRKEMISDTIGEHLPAEKFH